MDSRDGVGYYAYARAPLIEHSLDFTHDYQGANESFREPRLDESGQPKAGLRTVTGHLDNHFTVGPALLWSPFLLVAHAGVLLAQELGSSVRADGFSAPYRYAMALGTAIYGFLALFLHLGLHGNMWTIMGVYRHAHDLCGPVRFPCTCISIPRGRMRTPLSQRLVLVVLGANAAGTYGAAVARSGADRRPDVKTSTIPT